MLSLGQSNVTEGKKPISAGPWGGYGGSQFDDGVYTGIRQLVVVHAAAIDSIQIEYDKKGSSAWSDKHGGNGGTKIEKIKLDFPDEVLTSISGYYGSLSNGSPVIVRSLTFESNRAKYGPYGFQQGTHFSFPMTGGKIVGFHGRCGWYLDSVGVYLKALQKSNLSNSLLPSLIGNNVVQGTVGKGYDIVLAVREKEDKNNVLWNTFSRQFSDTEEFTSMETRSTVVSFPSYSLKERSTTDGPVTSGPWGKEAPISGGPVPSGPWGKEAPISGGPVPSGPWGKEAPISGGPVTYGPWGGSGGIIFDDGVYTGVRQVNVSRNVGIVSIKVLYDRNGQAIWGNKHGGSGGIKTDKISFDYPYEVLTDISGFYGTTFLMGPTAIKSLTFHTTKRKYGPYGDEQGIFFSSNMKAGMIIGFHGRKGWYIDSIGVHVLEGKLSLPQPSLPGTPSLIKSTAISEVDNPEWSNKLVLTKSGFGGEEVYGVVKEPVPSGPGPWGGDGGRPWDDGVYSGIKQIIITRGQSITSIQMEYDRNGQSVWSTKHGAGGGEATHRVQFEYPNEVLNCISGYYSSINRDERPKVITSLTFYTTRGKYGPYGEEIGTFFTSTTTEGKVVGFHGRSGRFLDAIGVHMQHWLGQRKTSKSLISKFF